jgi:hypothetical protein
MKNWISIWLACKSYLKSYAESYMCRRPLPRHATFVFSKANCPPLLHDLDLGPRDVVAGTRDQPDVAMIALLEARGTFVSFETSETFISCN